METTVGDDLSKFSWIRCGRKRRHEQADTAARIARVMSKRTGAWLIAYECIDCGGWRVGKAPQDQQIVRAQPKTPRKNHCNYCGKMCNGVYCDATCRKSTGKS
jgi:hypothetical protein